MQPMISNVDLGVLNVNGHSVIKGNTFKSLCACADCNDLYSDWCERQKARGMIIRPIVNCTIFKPGYDINPIPSNDYQWPYKKA